MAFFPLNSNLVNYPILINGYAMNAAYNGTYSSDEDVKVTKNSNTSVTITFPRKVKKLRCVSTMTDTLYYKINGVKLTGTSIDGYFYQCEIEFEATNNVTITISAVNNSAIFMGDFS